MANSDAGTVSILPIDGDGTVVAAVSYAVGVNPESLAISDLEGDADADLAVSNKDSENAYA